MQRSDYGPLLRYYLQNLSRKVTQHRWLPLQPTVVRLWRLINAYIYIRVVLFVSHTGPVLCVRWAASGKWLASGSDDTLVMIWDLDP